jgi:hypothetical protein
MAKMEIYLIVVLALLELCSARIGFVKDQSITKVKFPPVIKKQPAMPTGHLRPLGKWCFIMKLKIRFLHNFIVFSLLRSVHGVELIQRTSFLDIDNLCNYYVFGCVGSYNVLWVFIG